jgi:NADH:ubiquinone oxidoreductase subunit 6 (subunit J)
LTEETTIAVAFWVIAITTVVCALMVAAVRDLVHAVIFLVLTFVGVAGIYVVLAADFVAVVQILIYAGAISVLMVFAIMLTPASDRRNSETAFRLPAAVISVLVLAVVAFVAYDTEWALSDREAFATTARSIGEALLSPYVVAFEIAAVLLTAAMIGAIVLARGEEEEDTGA